MSSLSRDPVTPRTPPSRSDHPVGSTGLLIVPTGFLESDGLMLHL